MSAKPQVTERLYTDDWGLYIQHLVNGVKGEYGKGNEYAIYRPVPSKAFHEPQRVFNKLRAVEDSQFVATGGMWFNVSFVGKGYALVHTKDTKFGKTGRRELWAWHGTVPGSGRSSDAWEPYSGAMEYWGTTVPGVSSSGLTEAKLREAYDKSVADDTAMPFSRGVQPWVVAETPDDEYNAYVAELKVDTKVSDDKMWTRTNRFIRELQKQ